MPPLLCWSFYSFTKNLTRALHLHTNSVFVGQHYLGGRYENSNFGRIDVFGYGSFDQCLCAQRRHRRQRVPYESQDRRVPLPLGKQMPWCRGGWGKSSKRA